ncbi:MAG: hypothetical protein NT070_19240 [Cyanobacteria bacterium]|nr:hypothetical protein [Cyanobacteriota bacterium]
MKLPYGAKTDLQQIINKLDTYSLDFNHSSGKHKARLFEAKLGITKENKNVLITAIRDVAATSEYAQFTRSDEYGDRYVIVFDLETNFGSSSILSAWIIHYGETYPRLTSIYPIR